MGLEDTPPPNSHGTPWHGSSAPPVQRCVQQRRRHLDGGKSRSKRPPKRESVELRRRQLLLQMGPKQKCSFAQHYKHCCTHSCHGSHAPRHLEQRRWRARGNRHVDRRRSNGEGVEHRRSPKLFCEVQNRPPTSSKTAAGESKAAPPPGKGVAAAAASAPVIALAARAATSSWPALCTGCCSASWRTA